MLKPLEFGVTAGAMELEAGENIPIGSDGEHNVLTKLATATEETSAS